MKNYIFGAITGIIVTVIAYSLFSHNLNEIEYANYQTLQYKSDLIDAYRQYYKGTEELLDDIDSEYNWCDSFDNFDYYEGRDRVNQLISLEK